MNNYSTNTPSSGETYVSPPDLAYGIVSNFVEPGDELVRTTDGHYHVPPPNLDLRRLDEEDGKFSWHHLKIMIIAGIGFLSDSYDVFVIGLALPMLYRVYFPPEGNNPFEGTSFNKDHPHLDAFMKASTSWGNFLGQLIFGYLGDKYGRKKIYGVEMIIMIVGIIGSTLAADTVRGINVLAMLAFWRFILGFGIGGDYPMSATISAEFSYPNFRGRMVSGVFSMQGVGILVGAAITLIFLVIFQTSIRQDPLYLDYVWRFMLGLGLVPCIFTIGYRMMMPESPHYNKVDKELGNDDEYDDPKCDSKLLSKEISSIQRVSSDDTIEISGKRLPGFKEYFSEWRNFKTLFGTCFCWFALDIAWYGLSLNNQVVLELAGYADKNVDQYTVFFQKAAGNMLIACMGTVPGYFVSVYFIDKIGRLRIQKYGFLVITACLFILAGLWDTISHHKFGFLFVYSVAQFFFNFGPNVTTYVIPSEVFPTHIRARAHGISAAVGKFGAIIGVQAIGPFFFSNVKGTLWSFGAVMFTGYLATFLLPEMKGKSLEIWDHFDENGKRIQVDPEIP